MSGLQRAVRHPDRTNDPHARAHRLASDALLETLPPDDVAWLEAHLASCAPCRAVADAFAADAALLHGLRDDVPPVPRDLGARVSHALDEELRRAVRRGRSRMPVAGGSVPGSRQPRRPSLALAGLAAAAVVALVVVPLAAQLGLPTAPAEMTLAPGATPIAVDTEPVAWVRRAPDGTYVISSAPVDKVCPGVDASACGTLDGGAQTLAALDVKPSALILPRAGNEAVVVGGNGVYAVVVSTPHPVTTSPPEPSTSPSATPVEPPAATGGSASPPVDTPSPSGASVSPGPAETPATTPVVPMKASPSPEPVSPSPSAPSETAPPSPTPSVPGLETSTPPEPPTPLPTLPPGTPAPTAAATLAIAEGVVLVGPPPAYSPDGRWVAFSARPVDGSAGPDVLVWKIGTNRARVLTSDHATVFAGWHDGSVLASTARRLGSDAGSSSVPAAGADPATVVARSVLIDPQTGKADPIPHDGIWRPVVDPTERVVVYWSGSLAWSPVDHAWMPGAGSLAITDWPSVLDPSGGPAGRALPGDTGGTGTFSWDARFDPAGRHLGIWIADPLQDSVGHLALVEVRSDATLGNVILSDASALPGFSLDADRLAWSTPPGRNGQGSLVTVYAWRGELAGQVYSVPDPGNEPVVVGH